MIPGVITPTRTSASDGAIPIRPIKIGTTKNNGEPRSRLAKNASGNNSNGKPPNGDGGRTNGDGINEWNTKAIWARRP